MEKLRHIKTLLRSHLKGPICKGNTHWSQHRKDSQKLHVCQPRGLLPLQQLSSTTQSSPGGTPADTISLPDPLVSAAIQEPRRYPFPNLLNLGCKVIFPNKGVLKQQLSSRCKESRVLCNHHDHLGLTGVKVRQYPNRNTTFEVFQTLRHPLDYSGWALSHAVLEWSKQTGKTELTPFPSTNTSPIM